MRGPETAGAHFSLTGREVGMSCWPGVGPSPVTAPSPRGPPGPDRCFAHPQTCAPTPVLSTVLSWHPGASLGGEQSASTTLPSGTRKPFKYHLRHRKPRARGCGVTDGDSRCHRALDVRPALLEHRHPLALLPPFHCGGRRKPDLQNQPAPWHGLRPLGLRARRARTS